MTDLTKLAEDSYTSAFRRFPNSDSGNVIQKIHEEIHELEDAYLNEGLSVHCPELTEKEEEFADIIFACLVFAKCENIDIEKALRVKNEFNKTRQ